MLHYPRLAYVGTGTDMPLDNVDPFYLKRIVLRKNVLYLTPFPFVLTCDDLDRILSLEPHYSTSGARETMRMKALSLSSRATGPKMRVPRGFKLSVSTTAAFSSKRI